MSGLPPPAEAEGDRTLPPRRRILLLRRGGSECGGLAEGEEGAGPGWSPALMHTLAGDGGVHSSLLYIVVFLLCI